MNDYMTVKEVSEYLRLTTKTVRLEIKKKNLASVRLGPKGGTLLVPREDLKRYVQERTEKAWVHVQKK